MDPIALTRELVALDTPTGGEAAAVDFLAAALAKAGYRVTRQPVTPGRDNLYAWREPPELVFSTHLDCVPPFVAPREDAERLWGRGTCDAKGLAAAMVAAAERLAESGERRVGLLFLVGEENGSDGAKKAPELESRGRYLINGEPTENRLVVGQKGALRVDLEASGLAGHSAYPDEGRSAIDALLETLDYIRGLKLPTDPVLGPTTYNVGVIEGGVAPNVFAPWASAQLLFRVVEPTDALRQRVAACAAQGVTVSFPVELPCYKAPRPAPPGWDTTVVSYASDLPLLTAAFGEGYQLGPGSILVAHTADEHIEKADLLRGVGLYVKLAEELLGRYSMKRKMESP